MENNTTPQVKKPKGTFVTGLERSGLSAIYGASIAGGAFIFASEEFVFQDFLRIIALGGTLALTVEYVKEFSRGVSAPGRNKHPGRRTIPVNGRNVRFDYAIPQGDYIKVKSISDLWRSLTKSSPRMQQHKPVARPPELDEFKFFVNGMQLLESDVQRFLQNAWRNNARGRGLSERRWCGKNRETLPAWFKGDRWYWSFMSLIADTEDLTRVQMIAFYRNGWKMLLHNPRASYALLRYAYQKKRSDSV